MKRNQLRKVHPLIFASYLLPVILFSHSSKAANIRYQSIDTGGYIVLGTINKGDLVWVPRASFWAPLHTLVHETGESYFENEDNASYCYSNIDKTVELINFKLKSGIRATKKRSYANTSPFWTVTISCKITDSPADGGWTVTTLTPSPPDGAVCDTTVPLKVSFGTLDLGATNIKTVLDGTIKCDKDADVSLSFRGFDDGYIPIQDAKVKFTFDNGLPKHKITAKKNMLTNFKVNFEEISTGTTTGYKSASAVLVMQWQ